MKRVIRFIQFIAIAAALLTAIVLGIEIFTRMNSDYIITEAYIIGSCLAVNVACAIYRLFSCKCPHCRKIKLTNGKYCPYCGKEVGLFQ